MSKSGLRIAFFVIVVIALVVVYLGLRHKPNIKAPKPVQIDTQHQPLMGNPRAKIHFVAFEDLKCVNCKRFNNTLFKKIKKKYIDTGKANYTMINLAFIPGSLPAANAARCLFKQNKKYFYPFVEYVYAHQPPEDENWATIPTLLQYVKNADVKGVDMNRLGQCMVEGRYNGFINKNFKLAKKVMGDTVATPTLYINGMPVNPLTMDRVNALVKVAEKKIAN